MKTRNLHTIGSPSADRPTFHMLDEGRLEVGDVLLENSPTITSSAIRFFDRGAFSHALIYMGDDQVVEAVQRGVVFLSTRRIVTRDTSRWLHMRPATPLTPFQQQGLEYAVRAQAFIRSFRSRFEFGPVLVYAEALFACSYQGRERRTR